MWAFCSWVGIRDVGLRHVKAAVVAPFKNNRVPVPARADHAAPQQLRDVTRTHAARARACACACPPTRNPDVTGATFNCLRFTYDQVDDRRPRTTHQLTTKLKVTVFEVTEK